MTAPAAQAVLEDPDWLPFRLDPPSRRVLFLRLPADWRRTAAFLDRRILDRQPQGVWLPLSRWLDFPLPVETCPHFIFHLGHCGSTLLSRVLEEWPGVQTLREPLLLRELAVAWRDLDAPESWLDPQTLRRSLQATVDRLARPAPPARQALIKATSGCNDLIEPMLEHSPGSRAVLLHLPLAEFLASVLKSPQARRNALEFVPMRLAWLNRNLGGPSLRLAALAPAEAIALGWFAERLRFDVLAGGPLGSRLLVVDFGDLLADPEATLSRIAVHFGWERQAAAAAIRSPAFERHAKLPEHVYGIADREHDLALARERFGAEIQTGLRWAEGMAERVPLVRTWTSRASEANVRTGAVLRYPPTS